MDTPKGIHHNTMVMKMSISEDENIEVQVKEFKGFKVVKRIPNICSNRGI